MPRRSTNVARRLSKAIKNDVFTVDGQIASAGVSANQYDSLAALPLTGIAAGTKAFVEDSDRLYISNGTGWYSIALTNASPSITSVLDSDGGITPFTLATDGSATVITVAATDSDGTPLTYNYSVSSGSLNGSTVSQDSSVFTVTPHASNATTFDLTFTASDGINTATSGANSFTLSFSLNWDVSNASLNYTYNIYSETSDWAASRILKVRLGDNGTKLYTIGGGSAIYQYSLSTAFDLSSATLSSNSNNFSTVITNAGVTTGGGTGVTDAFFKPDGSKIYASWDGGTEAIYEFNLTTSWDVSTLSYVGRLTMAAYSGGSGCAGVYVGDSGSKLFVLERNYDRVWTYDLSTPWSVTSGSKSSTAAGSTSPETNPADITFKPDGTKMYVAGLTRDGVSQYSLSTAWDLATISADPSYVQTLPGYNCIEFKSDGNKFFTCNSKTSSSTSAQILEYI